LDENFRNSRSGKTRGLPVIKCSCGSKILLVPSVKEMSVAIEGHIEEHKHRVGNAAEAKGESERLRSDLIKQMFDLASELQRVFCGD